MAKPWFVRSRAGLGEPIPGVPPLDRIDFLPSLVQQRKIDYWRLTVNTQPYRFPIAAQLPSGPAGLAGYAHTGIPTGLVNANPSAPPGTSTITFFVAGVDRSSFVTVGSARINAQLGTRATASFTWLDETGTTRPNIDDDVVIYDGTTRVFAGTIESTSEMFENATSVMKVEVRCNDYGVLLDRRIVAEWYDAVAIQWTYATMIRDLIGKYLAGTGIFNATFVGDALILSERVFPHKTMTETISQLLDEINLDFRIDYWKGLHVFPKSTGYQNAPFNIADADGRWKDMTVTRSRGRYANTVYVRNDQGLPAVVTETFVGDGVARYFITARIMTQKPVVRVNGTLKTVQAYNAYAGTTDFTYVPDGFGVFSNPYQAPYTSSDTITVQYPGRIQPLISASDAAEIVTYGNVDIIEEVKDVWDVDIQQELADGLLLRRKVRPISATFTSRLTGFEPGQFITINTTQPLVPNVSMIIDSVSLAEEQNLFFWNTITATNQQIQGGGSQTRQMLRAIKLDKQPSDKILYKIVVKLAKTIPGITNPGLVAGLLLDQRVCEKNGYIRDVVLRWVTPPTNNAVEIDIYKNGVSIFGGAGFRLRWLTTDTGTVKRFDFLTDPYRVLEGDIITVEVITADATAKDGDLEISVQG